VAHLIVNIFLVTLDRIFVLSFDSW